MRSEDLVSFATQTSLLLLFTFIVLHSIATHCRFVATSTLVYPYLLHMLLHCSWEILL